MSTVRANTILDSSGGNTAQINGMTPTAQSLQGFRNRIINGGMTIAQRGTSFAPTVATYTLDRWLFSNGSSVTITQSTDVPAGFRNSISLTATGFPTLVQRIEALNCDGLVSQNATVSFWAKQTSGAGANSVGVQLNYPNAGADNYSGGVTPISTQTATGSTSWTYYTFNFTLPSNVANGLQINLFGNTAGAATILFTGVQLEAGSVATPFERRPYGQELALCQRYFQKTYQQSAAPGSTSTSQNGAVWSANPVTNSYPNIGTWNFAVPMRATPTVVGYNPETGAVGQFRGDSVNFSNLVTAGTGERSVTFFGSNVSVGGSVFMSCHGTASAEL